MKSLVNCAWLALAACLLSGCIATGDIKGERPASVSARTPVERVDVVFVDRPELALAGPFTFLANRPHIQEAQGQATTQLVIVFNNASRAVRLELDREGVRNRVFLQTTGPSAPADIASHVVVVMPKSVRQSDRMFHAQLDVSILDTKTREIVWKGISSLSSGSVLNQEAQPEKFALAMVKTLLEVGTRKP